jgi:hypothetical protein
MAIRGDPNAAETMKAAIEAVRRANGDLKRRLKDVSDQHWIAETA